MCSLLWNNDKHTVLAAIIELHRHDRGFVLCRLGWPTGRIDQTSLPFPLLKVLLTALRHVFYQPTWI